MFGSIKKLLHQLIRIICCVVLVVSLGTMMACTKVEPTEPTSKGLELTEEIEPIFLDIKYIYSTEEFDPSGWHPEFCREEGTWFRVFSPRNGITREDLKERMRLLFDLEWPESIYWGSESFVVISIGKKLESIYYYEQSLYLRTMKGRDGPGILIRPIFEREHYPGVLFVYFGSPPLDYNLLCNTWLADDFLQFNHYGNIPFDVWEFDRGILLEDGVHPWRRPFREGNNSGQWVEFTEPMYIYAPELKLRSLPTQYSRIIRASEIGYIAILGYVEDGEKIDESNRWYFVSVPFYVGGPARRVGYVHSSFFD